MSGSKFTNNKLIFKNTIMLYIRQILILFVGLYTSRVVLNALGNSDFGLYNLVGGIASMLGFLSSAMTTACQRYFSFNIGKSKENELNKTFVTSLTIYVIICILIIIFSETVGLWFINNKLVIADDRMVAANWVFQFSVLSFVITILGTPFTALIIAYEKMEIYARISVIECISRLVLVFVLNIFLLDKLITYGFLMMLLTLLVTSSYVIVCYKKFEACRIKLIFEKELILNMGRFISWNLLGNIAGTVYNLGSNVLINLFFGTTINTAKSIASQVNSAVNTFASHFSSAIQPQLVKNYASRNYDDMIKQLYNGIKLTFVLIYIFVLPLTIELPIVLNLWLGEYPDFTEQFAMLTLIATCIEVTTYSLDTIAQATGKVKTYQIVASTISLLNIPLSFVLLKIGADPYVVIEVYCVLICVSIFSRVLILSKLVAAFSVVDYFKNVIVKLFVLVLCTLPIPLLLKELISDSIFRLIFIVIICSLETCTFAYLVLFAKEERKILKKKISTGLRRLLNR